MVSDLLKAKVLIKQSNPGDKRSFLIVFNKKSGKSIYDGMKSLKALDKHLEELLGAKRSKELHKSLKSIISNYS